MQKIRRFSARIAVLIQRGFPLENAIHFVLKSDHLLMYSLINHELLIIKMASRSRQIPLYCRSCSLFEILILIGFDNSLIDDDI